ncbi:MAG: UDP-N-acetylmuramoyl-L-alanine--D-glutamate ligase, partial [Saccharothrix sp.]|nr:UDP-N-acetylmuramoyl-L-alanine--D-glutamate ligase [Saccharothrix sp.]
MGFLAGRHVLVAGAGVTGRSAAEALLAADAVVTVTDGSADRLAALEQLLPGVTLTVGLTEPPAGTDLVVTSPGWRPSSPLLQAATAAGIEVIGEVELAWRMGAELADPPTWLAVTGTNGKTTTVGMLESILRAAGIDAVACGNVGLPVVDALLAGRRVLAVELSSFQLHWSPSVRPFAGVLLNLAEDHLDWHGTFEAYAAAKAGVLTGEVAIGGVDDPVVASLL